jgi:type I restriction enzyme S subunit
LKFWPTKPLGELCDVEGGNAAPQGDENFRDGTIPFVRMKDLGRYHLTKNLCETDDKLTEASAAANGMKFFEPGCILFPRSGSVALNHRAILGVRASVVSHIGVLHNLRPEITPAFLYLYLTTFDMTALSKKTTGVDSIAFADVKRFPVPVPPLGEQEWIVTLLDEADELRKLRAHADRRTASLIPALFYEMFGDPTTNPFDWPVECVGNLFDQKRGGAKCGPFGSALKKHEYTETGIPVWGIPNILPNRFIEEGSLFITPSKFEELRAYSVESGDVLFSRAGTVGRICVARPKANHSIMGSNLIRLALDQQRIVPDFFSSLMTHFGTQVGRLRANSDEGAYSFMNTTVLKAPRIYVPPLPLQKEFAKRVTEIRELEAEQASSGCRLEDLFQSLLHRAFRGELC